MDFIQWIIELKFDYFSAKSSCIIGEDGGGM